MWVQKKMVIEHELLESIILHIQELNYEKCIYDLEYHVGEEALKSNLPPKFGRTKKIPLVGFLNCLLKNV
jgi:hypothetical protein